MQVGGQAQQQYGAAGAADTGDHDECVNEHDDSADDEHDESADDEHVESDDDEHVEATDGLSQGNRLYSIAALGLVSRCTRVY